MSSSFQPQLAALIAAARSGDADSALSMWREMSEEEQEDAVVQLLALVEGPADANTPLSSAVRVDDHTRVQGGVDDEAPAATTQTALVPVSVEILHELRAPSDESDEAPGQPRAPGFDVAAYRSRWRRRWKWSALVAAWAAMTVFAFTGDVSGFGPTEWIVSILMNGVGGGLLVGTLINFAVAAIPMRDLEHAEVPTTENNP